ncbi:MAG: Phosphoribosylaminoimidazole-succinocarboxamide synthase [Myxococcota bacterium]|nr:Phosphoribosylaminoimidazole-succinocarboxamide synthase [Myxococcota bacterium]
MVEKRDRLYEGKSKILYTTDNPDELVQVFKDDATAFNGVKKGTIAGKGELNCAITARIFGLLGAAGTPSHFIRVLSPREMLVQRLTIIPVEVVMRNIVAGSLSKRMGRPEGEKLPRAILETYLKSDELGDPPINDEHIEVFGLATPAQLAEMKTMARQINAVLVPFFRERGIDLVDYKLEFGVNPRGQLVLGDEITPDGCRLWDSATHEKMDKDRFRRDLGKVEEAYQEVARRVLG